MNLDGGIHEIPLPGSVGGRLWLCGKHVIGPDPEALLTRVGADVVVCLTEEYELADRYPDYVAWLRGQAPERVIWFAISDLHAPDLDRFTPMLDDLVGRLVAGRGTIVHCAAGIGRAGTTAVAVLVSLGTPLDDALTHVRAHRPAAGPEVGPQLDLVQAVAARALHGRKMTTTDLAVALRDDVVALVERAEGLVVVGIDGRSGAGKSTLAHAAVPLIESAVGGTVVVIEGDLFYAGGSAAAWDRRSAQDKSDQVIDWRRQRRVLDALRATGEARWRPFDWGADDWDADVVPLAAEAIDVTAERVVILEGAYSCRPELHDLLDRRILVDPPRDVRRHRLLHREGAAYRADWEGRWAVAEDHYFGTVMPPAHFDLVLP